MDIIIVIGIIIAIIVIVNMLWQSRGSDTDRQFRSDVAQLKRVNRDIMRHERTIEKLKKELFDG